MNKLKNILDTIWDYGKVPLIILVAFLLLTNLCDRYAISENPFDKNGYRVIKTETETKYKTHYDTVTIIRQPIVQNITREKIFLQDTATYIHNDTSYKVLEFKSKFEDTLIAGNIFSKVLLDGTLVHQDLEYTPKFPKYITKTDSVFTTHTKYVERERRLKFAVGLGASIGLEGNYYSLQPEVGLVFKKGDAVGVNYDVLNNAIGVRYTRIFNYNK